MSRVEKLKQAAKELSEKVSELEFTEEITHIYNPLDYAWKGHEAYIETAGNSSKKIIFLGMNPGPWGMAQTGVPFGEVSAVTGWIGIKTDIEKPKIEHPKRAVEGFSCGRSEVSGKRLWGLMADRFGRAENFFADHYVANYCPISFMTETGRNFTPDKLPKKQQQKLFEICDEHLRAVVSILEPEWVLGIGKFAEKRINTALEPEVTSGSIKTGTVLHPSPASPAANRGWAEAATAQMIKCGLWS